MSAKKIIFWLVSGFIVVFVAFVGYQVREEKYKYDKLRDWTEKNEGVIFTNDSELSFDIVSTNTSKIRKKDLDFDFTKYKITNGVINTTSPYHIYSLPPGIVNSIIWGNPTKISPLGFFSIEHTSGQSDKSGENILSASDYYLIGIFEFENKTGAIVVADVVCLECMMGAENPEALFVLYDNKVVFLDKSILENKSYYATKDYLVRSHIFIDEIFSFPEVNKPVTIERNGKQYNLIPTYHDGPVMRSHDSSLSKLAPVFYHPILGSVYQLENKFEIIGVDGRSWFFQYRPGMVNQDNDFVVVFENEIKNTYKYISPNGCGRMTDPAIANSIATSSLKKVGMTGGKYPVYISDDNVLLHQLYDSMYFPEGDGKISYEKFVADYPIVYFYDDFGRLIQATEKKYQPAAECGKPVIYLYPKKTTKVMVRVDLSHWSYSDPEYHGGWEVLAEPNGRLTETRTGKKYPYLFWEGTGVGEQPKANSGFVIKREEVSEFLSKKLFQLGLNTKESADFREFWEPRMTRAPYYFVTFYGTSAMNAIAPLTIEPKPDTVIRILMDYRPLKKYEEVKEQKLSAPARRGFAVIEWGGVLGRE